MNKTETVLRTPRSSLFVRILAGRTASMMGDQITSLALPWLILFDTHSPIVAGVITALGYVPSLVFGLWAGTLVDRLDRRTLLLGSDMGRALMLATVAAMGLARVRPPLVLLAALVLVLGSGRLLFQVAFGSWLPDLLGSARLTHALAAFEAGDAISVLAGYPLAGSLITLLGPATALGGDMLSYAVSALSLLALPSKDSGAPGSLERADSKARSEKGRRLAHDVWAGFRTLWRSRTQRRVKGLATALYLEAGSIEILLVTLTQLRLHLPAWQAGLVFAGAGVGGLATSALGPRLFDQDWRRGTLFALGEATIGLLLLARAAAFPHTFAFWLALMGNVILDGGIAMGFVFTGSATMLLTSSDVRGRTLAASNLYGSLVRAISCLGAGALAASGNPMTPFLVLAGVCAFGSVLSSRAMRAEEAS